MEFGWTPHASRLFAVSNIGLPADSQLSALPVLILFVKVLFFLLINP